VRQRRWTDPTQPQTLQIAVFLLYLDGFFGLLRLPSLSGLVAVVAGPLSGYLIANEKKIGYRLGVAFSMLRPALLILFLFREGLDELFEPFFLLNAMFPVAQLLLLVHPTSRDYQRIWFK
jgi:hypothetical protein